jgi:lysophospholipid acyltransferase (LPLAT)-like uncharacterized protein
MNRSWLVGAIALLVRVVRLTNPTRRVGWARVARLRDRGEPVAFALQHGGAVLMLAELSDDGCTALVSKSRDGDLATGLLQALGFGTVRGSSSSAAASGLRGLVRAIGRGEIATITVDGPRGPAGQVAPGIAALSKLSGAWIVPLAASGSRTITLPTWDRTQIPLPLSRNYILFGRPLRVSAESGVEATRQRLTQQMDNLSRRANRLAGRKR